METIWLKKSVPENTDVHIFTNCVGEDEVMTNKVKRNEEKVRFLRVLDKSQNAKY